ncbi:MAG: hypothetical protein K2X73_03505 [Sphingomonas sp.]|nr:hypothetical protein [Sphingomonas sp.]
MLVMARPIWLIAMGAALVAAAPAQAPAVLAGIEPGNWQLRELGSGTTRALCITDPASLLQIEHGMADCSRRLIDDSPRAATVHYTCPGAGHGRTVLTLETGRSLALETQGIDHGAPFDLRYQLTRTGACQSARK